MWVDGVRLGAVQFACLLSVTIVLVLSTGIPQSLPDYCACKSKTCVGLDGVRLGGTVDGAILVAKLGARFAQE